MTIQQPKPTTIKSRHNSFLSDFVDPVYPDPRHGSINIFVSKWLESIGSDQKERCRSDSHLHRLDDDLILKEITKSAPEMSCTRDAGLVDADTASVLQSDLTYATPSSGRLPRRSLVENPLYREMNLATNNIYLRPLSEQFPQHIADLVDSIRGDRDSPGPSLDHIRQDSDLNKLWTGAGELEVEEYFRANIFPYPKSLESLKRSDRQLMARHTVPDSRSKLRVSTPVPDMLYGYDRNGAFLQQQSQLISMGTEMVANNQGLLYPFLVIEFKGDGPTGGGTMWVAANQCLGGSTSCVKIAEQLNRRLEQCRLINSAAFSIAMNGTEARLYISWKHNELSYYMANVKNFLLQEPEHFLEFRKYALNIIDWGKGRRLKEIQDSLDGLLGESRKRVSKAAKSRLSPPDGSGISRNKKRKSSSGRVHSEPAVTATPA
jgi:hypothetical protein